MSEDLPAAGTPKEKALAEAGAGAEVALDAIEEAQVSESWKRSFRAIEKAGLISGGFCPRFENVDPADHRHLMFNFGAFFFGPIYYFYLGMWRKGLTWVSIAAAILAVAMGLPAAVTRALGIGLQVLYASNANTDYYRKQIQGETFWV
jgi:hypothetical protein